MRKRYLNGMNQSRDAWIARQLSKHNRDELTRRLMQTMNITPKRMKGK